MTTIDYNAKLAQDTTVIRDKVRRGMLPLVARCPALDKATREYAEAQAEHYAGLRNPPIALRDSDALDRCADLVLYEELTWSHPDKMSIVEFPVMSDRQVETRRIRETSIEDVHYSKSGVVGWRKSSGENTDGVPYSGRQPIHTSEVVSEARLAQFEHLYVALDNARLTARQRQAIDLVYFEDMTQEAAAEAMGIRQQTLFEHLGDGMAKLRAYMT